VKVHDYVLTNEVRDGALAPRAWRVSTDDGVFWLAEAGSAARLVRLPLDGRARSGPDREAGPWSALARLASTAEAEAAGRWVRAGRSIASDAQVSQVADARP
jgi:hypothetical protein